MEKALKAAVMGLKRVRPPRSRDLVELYRASGLKLSGEVSERRVGEALGEHHP